MTTTKTKNYTTCQICARAIKSKSGFIAHHGYTRPHQQGWQTASCMGAKHRPYEVSCDALPPAIESCKRYIETKKAFVQDLLDNPPATIEYQRRDSWGSAVGSLKTYTRPENFDSRNDERHFSGVPGTEYKTHFNRRRDGALQDIKGTEQTMVYFEERLTKWQPVEVKVEA